MKLRIVILVSVLVLFTSFSNAQEYFQQEVNYEIKVRLNDETHTLHAIEKIEYVNNSPDALEFIYFHLWPNAYKNNQTALAAQKMENGKRELFNIPELQGYIDSLDFKVNGKPVRWEYDKEHIDICILYLDEPLQPNQGIEISTPFRVKIPKGVTSRLGHIEQSYQITQWFPKPAVYDRFGWHPMPYLNQGEFYSEFGSFDVSIRLPKNYVVGATGDLQNEEEIQWLNDLAKKTAEKNDFDQKDMEFPESSREYKTLRYIQHNVHDFAWFADKRFNVLKSEVELPHSKRKVTSWAMFTNDEADLWLKAPEYINDALYYYSLWFGDYPYNHATAVLSALTAGGGMEYPNITVIGGSQNDRMLEMVIMHEVGHNWFYGIFGFNERDYAWQDEGINSFAEARYMRTKYGEDDSYYKNMGMNDEIAKLLGADFIRYNTGQELAYNISASLNTDQHASLTSADYLSLNYGTVLYMKGARIFDYLLGYLGEDEFNRIMLKFYDKWKFKHPYPQDIQALFENESGKDLAWLFDDLLKTTKKNDYKISKFKNNQLHIKNIGDIAAPVNITAYSNNEKLYSTWVEGFEKKHTITLPDSVKADKIIVDPDGYMLDINRQNNRYDAKSLFKKVEPLKLGPINIIDNPAYTQIGVLPAMGWNHYNKYMLGLLIHNPILPVHKFQYLIIPMYGFGNNNLAGNAGLAYRITPYNSFIQNLTLSLTAKQYAYTTSKSDNYQRFGFNMGLAFRKSHAKSGISHNLQLQSLLTSNLNSVNDEYEFFQRLKFTHNNQQLSYKYNLSLSFEGHEDFVKSSLEGNLIIPFTGERGKNIKLRLFGGSFLYKSNQILSQYAWQMSALSGANDYTFDHNYLGRFENPGNNFAGKQIVPAQGGFISADPQAITDTWIVAANFSTSIPKILDLLPVDFYLNAAVMGDSDQIVSTSTLNSAWEAGVKLRVINNVFEVYFPITAVSEFNEYANNTYKNYKQQVRFSLRVVGLLSSPETMLQSAF